MTNFEKAKQEIIHAIGELQEVYVGRKTRTQIYAMINHLQPPAPPKCSTCKHRFGLICNTLTKSIELFGNHTDVVMLHSINKFGCIHHSDYDKDGEV